jgi:hypothetical protein
LPPHLLEHISDGNRPVSSQLKYWIEIEKRYN